MSPAQRTSPSLASRGTCPVPSSPAPGQKRRRAFTGHYCMLSSARSPPRGARALLGRDSTPQDKSQQGCRPQGARIRGILCVTRSSGQSRARREGKEGGRTAPRWSAGWALGWWGEGREGAGGRVGVPQHSCSHWPCPGSKQHGARTRTRPAPPAPKGRACGAVWLTLHPGLPPPRSWDRRPSCAFAAWPSLRIRNLGTPLFFCSLEESVEAGPLP